MDDMPANTQATTPKLVAFYKKDAALKELERKKQLVARLEAALGMNVDEVREALGFPKVLRGRKR